MEIEEAGPNPVRIAREVHRQLGEVDGAVDLKHLANHLDIHEIKYEPLVNIEGALVTDASRACGSILVNSKSRKTRRRFTIAHELGHYLNLSHVESAENGFWCNKSDLNVNKLNRLIGPDRQENQEVEANRFASELLMPSRQIKRSLSEEICLEEVFSLAKIYGVSKEAMARRYAELRTEQLAILFSKDGKLRYPVSSRNMAALCLNEGEVLPHLDQVPFNRHTHVTAEVNRSDWLYADGSSPLICEHYPQRDGYAMTLLRVDE